MVEDICKPWEKSEYHDTYTALRGRHRGRGGYGGIGRFNPLVYKRTFKYLDDNCRHLRRKGDIVKFNDGRKHPWKERWEDWFLTEKDWIESLPWSGKIPRYAANQYAVIAGRYKVIKNKFGCEFADYGVIVMMLTGSRKGHLRKYYLGYPFDIINAFPYINPPRVCIELIDSFMKHHEDTNESRNLFLESLYKKLNS